MSLREGVRALILDPDEHVLLVRFDWPGLGIPGGFWTSPGGGVEAGETRFEAIRRELLEEVGLEVDGLGPELWTKTAVFPIGEYDGQVDHVYLLRVERFDPRPGLSAEQLRAEKVHELRWWSPVELRDPGATFGPRALPDLLERLRDEGVPPAPIELTGF